MARILLVEDHPSFRQALAFMLRQVPEVDTVAHAGSSASPVTETAPDDSPRRIRPALA